MTTTRHVHCLACKEDWTEPDSARPGAAHLAQCPVPYVGEGDGYYFKIRVHHVRRIVPVLALVPNPMPVDRDDLNRLYDRLEAPAWVPPSRRS